LQGLKNLGPTLRHWRAAWNDLRSKAPDNLSLPTGAMTPVGYIIMQHGMRDSRPVQAYQRWMDKIPAIYRSAVLNEALVDEMPPVLQDPDLLAHLKHFRSLMPLAMEANKPMFSLKPADGAIGAHVNAVNDCHRDFLKLATKLAASAGVALN